MLITLILLSWTKDIEDTSLLASSRTLGPPLLDEEFLEFDDSEFISVFYLKLKEQALI
jgi:hypothetical protein